MGLITYVTIWIRRVDFIAADVPELQLPYMRNVICTLEPEHVRVWLFCYQRDQLAEIRLATTSAHIQIDLARLIMLYDGVKDEVVIGKQGLVHVVQLV